MNTTIKSISFLLVCVLVGSGSFYLGKQQSAPAVPAVQAAASQIQAERKILYYRNPMGEPDTSPTPKQDSMGMDYVPVYEGEDIGSGTVAISPEKIQLLGVRTEAVKRRALIRHIRASGSIEIDERKQEWVAPRFEGWIQQLHVNTTGEHVARGQALLTIYSPELESAAYEVQLAQESGLPELEKSARKRLGNWQIAAEDLQHLQHGMKHLVLRAPIDGVVVEKMAVQGARFAPGEVLFKLADLSNVWLQAEVAEQDQGAIRVGQTIQVSIDAYPGEIFSGKVSFIAPLLNANTRTVRVRVELSNKNARLRPGMYANVDIAGVMQPALTVPISAVIDSGTRQVVLVQIAEGRFQPRAVKLGERGEINVVVLDGLSNGEIVVTQGNFLLDAESNLRAALSGLNKPTTPDEPEASSAPASSAIHPETAPQAAADHSAHQHGGH
ncbi:MAG: efflux RND transporter periplasmic adaptor subunit [Gallionellaceae bacterium]|jgi:Cu(I)/Ag(I) efflux system membrane fusion protein